MKTRSIACVATLLAGFAVPPMAFAGTTNVTSLLNMANQMNNQEEANAKEVRSKAGDNQALVTMADTLSQDHKANQVALEALAKQKNITLDAYKPSPGQERMDNLKGARFDHAFLKMDVRDHKQALSEFKEARANLSGDPDVKVYIDQTIPVLETHLKMAESLRHDDKVLGSAENPANNKAAN
ncbi:MAG TPA: DUF4142 domain-containing protein [Candidatus Binataceae bacterium]